MARLIDADLLLEQMKRRKDFIGRPSDPVCLVEDAPTIEAEPVKHGRWELIDEQEPRRYGCSKCKSLSWEASNYCLYCGAKMDLEVNDGT